MRLDYDCMRDIMLKIEEYDNMDIPMTIQDLFDKFNGKYKQDKLENTCLELQEGNFISLRTIDKLGTFHKTVLNISGLTWEGHQFLDIIRSESIWDRIQKMAKKYDLPLSVDSIRMFSEYLLKETVKKETVSGAF